MRYIFEDKKDSELSELFRIAYSDNISVNFIYAEGNRNIPNKLVELFEEDEFAKSNEKVLIYIDVVPDNVETVDLYNYLLAKSELKYDNRLVIIPILCSEYYFIKSISNSNLVNDRESVDKCLEKFNYKQSPCITQDLDNSNYESFENYCKLVQRKAFIRCVRHMRGR